MGWLEEWGLKLTSAKVVVEFEAELGNKQTKKIVKIPHFIKLINCPDLSIIQ